MLSENQKEKVLRKISLYYTEKNFNFVRVFCKIFYTLFTFDFAIEKIPLYNTEKNARFVDVFLEKIYKLFSRKRKILAMQARIINIILQFRYLIF